MGKNIADQIENLIGKKFPDGDQINDFIRADEEYKKLIQEGLAIKRGFNIMTTEEIYNPVLNYTYTQSID